MLNHWRIDSAPDLPLAVIEDTEEGFGICEMAPQEGKQALANARLIAAAPDLLAALESLFEHCAMVHKHWGHDDNTKQANAAQQAARDAIAKATGE